MAFTLILGNKKQNLTDSILLVNNTLHSEYQTAVYNIPSISVRATLYRGKSNYGGYLVT